MSKSKKAKKPKKSAKAQEAELIAETEVAVEDVEVTAEAEMTADAEELAAEAPESEELSAEEEAANELEAADAVEDDGGETAALDDKNVFEEMIEAAGTAEENEEELAAHAEELEGSELEGFESAAIDELEFIEDERLESIIEAMLFASDRPISFATFKMTFKGTNIKSEMIRRTLENLSIEYAGGRRGISLDEVPGGYQLRTKLDNMKFLTRNLKVRPFKVSGPALEVLSIVAYKQPVIKSEIDDIRGVESGHLLRALMEKGLVQFEGKSDFPGRPMLYGTSKKFLEIFGLRNLKELPTLSQIDELLPEGIGEDEGDNKPKLADVTDEMSQALVGTYSDGEEELMKISATLEDIDVSSEFFEKEKLKQRESRDAEKATNLREAVMLGEEIPTRDKNWLQRYDEALASGTTLAAIATQKEKARLANVKNKKTAGTMGEAESSDAQADAIADGAVAVELSADAEASVALEVQDAEEILEEDAEARSIAGELSALSIDSEEDEDAPVRFDEEEDISLDQDLNVPYHDDEEADGEPEAQA